MPRRAGVLQGRPLRLLAEAKPDSSHDMIEFWPTWAQAYPIISIEDGLDENDWAGWALLTQKLGKKVQLVGDDLFVTNVETSAAAASRAGGQLHPDQGQPDRHADRDAEAVFAMAEAGYTSVVSHRCGETEDTTIADLGGYGRRAHQDRFGRPQRTTGEIQPAAADRGRARQRRHVRRQRRHPRAAIGTTPVRAPAATVARPASIIELKLMTDSLGGRFEAPFQP